MTMKDVAEVARLLSDLETVARNKVIDHLIVAGVEVAVLRTDIALGRYVGVFKINGQQCMVAFPVDDTGMRGDSVRLANFLYGEILKAVSEEVAKKLLIRVKKIHERT